MKTVRTFLHRRYTVTSTAGCSITTPQGQILCSFQPPEVQKPFTATSDTVQCSDDAADIQLAGNTSTAGPAGESGQLQPYHSGPLPATLEAGHAYDLGTLATATDLSALAAALPALPDRVQTAELWFSLGDTAPAITWPQDAAWPEETSALAPAALATARAYRFALRREPGGKLIICRAYEYSLANS